jgi:3-hydroxyacyl-CoA dehydrogenase
MAKEIQIIAVIGAGNIGREIAWAALVAGYRVILEDVSESRLTQAVDWIAGENAEARARLVAASDTEEAVRDADLIVEAVADEMEMKIEMFTIFDKFAKPDTIFASASPSLSIAELGAVTFCPERCIGMRFTSRAPKEGALDLACSADTSETTVALCREVGRRMGKEVMVVTERELTKLR